MRHKHFTTFPIVLMIFFFFMGQGFAEVTLVSPAGYDIVDDPDVGTVYYVDRTYEITAMPEGFAPDFLIRTKNDDRDDEITITFTLSEDATVYVAYDSRTDGDIPCWMSCFEPAGQIETDDVTLNLYKKFYPVGEVVLGWNYACGNDCSTKCVTVPKGSNYIVFIDEGTTPPVDTDVVRFVCPGIKGVDSADSPIDWSEDGNTRLLGLNSVSILGGMATVTGYSASGEAPLSHRLTRGLGVSGGEPDEVDGNESIQIEFVVEHLVYGLELRSLYDASAAPPNVIEAAAVDFYRGGVLIHTETLTGSELQSAGGNGVADVSYPEPIRADRLVFYVPGGLSSSQFALAKLDADSANPDAHVISFVYPAIKGVDPPEPSWSGGDEIVNLGVSSLSLLEGKATLTGFTCCGEGELSHLFTRGLGVFGGESDEVDGDESIEIAFTGVYGINSLELRSLFDELSNPSQNVIEEGVVDFYFGESITHTEVFVGSEPVSTGGKGDAAISYATPILTDRLVFYVPEGLAGSEFALARLVVEEANFAEIKKSAKSCLSAYVNESKRFGRAIQGIDKSLEPKYWVDDTHLACRHGNKVFDHERYAVKQLMHLLKGSCEDAKCSGISEIELEYNGTGENVEVKVLSKFFKKKYLGSYTVSQGDAFVVQAADAGNGKLPAEIRLYTDGKKAAEIHTSCSRAIEEGDIYGEFEIVNLEKQYRRCKSWRDPVSEPALACAEAAIQKLVKVDRLLAETLVTEADGMVAANPYRQKKVDGEVTRAKRELVKGDSDRDKGRYDKAIGHYKKAWKHACLAVKMATKS